MVTRISVKPNVLKWAVKESRKDPNEFREKFPKFDEWMSGETDPTVNQLKQFGKKTNIPFGYLLLDEPVKEDIPLLNFRTVDSIELEHPSRELIDTIHDMERKQEWMREYLISEGFDEVAFISSVSIKDEVKQTANKVKKTIEVPIDWYEKLDQNTTAYNYFKKQIQQNNILVFQNGIVGSNTHRPLNVDEFRGFALKDDMAPLIFINTRDSNNGKLFTLLHELIHLFLGNNSLMSGGESDVVYDNKTEQFCNAVTAEILVPTDSFVNLWNINKDVQNIEKINILAKKFKVSRVVIARKALDLKYIGERDYLTVVDLVNQDVEMKNNKIKSSGGNYYATANTRLDPKLVFALQDNIQNGNSLYTDIYKLTGMKINTFEKLSKQLNERGVER